jgi:hypothetical protein
MRLRSMSAPLALTLLTASLTLGCGEADKADDGGADGAADGSSADDGADDGATDGSGDGAADGTADGSADGGDGSADGGDGSADGGDGSADGGDDGTVDPTPVLVYTEGFEDPEIPADTMTTSTAPLPGWTTVLFSNAYETTIDGVSQWVAGTASGAILRPSGAYDYFDASAPLASPAEGNQTAMATHYSTGAQELRSTMMGDPSIVIAPETAYTMRVAVGSLRGYVWGTTDLTLHVSGMPTDAGTVTIDLETSGVSGGWFEAEVTYDPPDSLSGLPLMIELAYTSTIAWGSYVAWDNVRIYATPAPPN